MAGVEVRAVQRNNRMSAQKVRLVLDVVRGKNAREALAILKFLPQRAARSVGGAPKCLLSADSVEKLVWQSGAGKAAKFDLIEWPLLNATRSGDGL